MSGYIPAVQFKIANMNQQRWHSLAEIASPQLNWQESVGATRTSRDTISSLLCLSTKLRSKKHETNKVFRASYASPTSRTPVTVQLSPFYSLSKHLVFSHGWYLSKTPQELYQLTSIGSSLRKQKPPEHHQNIFGYEVTTNDV